ncbi:MAG: hypothetical protein J5786_00810 [Clostridiales bacterium]|nr:hypothetical protein [Clostridiales bacterium]
MDFKKLLKDHLGVPAPLNWSYPMMISGLGALFVFGIRYFFFKYVNIFSPTSPVGNAVFSVLLVIFALLIPVALLSSGNIKAITGKYTGIGVLFLSLISGIPLMLINTAFHNLMSYFWLRISGSMIYPAYFSYSGNSNDIMLRVFTELTGFLIPAIGICLFFYGLIWSRIRKKERNLAYITITLAFTVFELNLIDIVGIVLIGFWLCFLRSKTENVYCPLLALIGMKLTEIFFGSILNSVDITSIITYSDISSSYFYASVPAIFVAIILLAFFRRVLNEFNYTFNQDLYGEDGVDEEMLEHDRSLPVYAAGLNTALIISGAIFIFLWVMVFNGLQF